MASIEERVENLVKLTIESLGYKLYDVQYAKEGKDYFLRIFIDKQEGIDLEDCEKVSNEINDILEEANYIKEQYFLEVSSPGVERLLRKERHLEENIGKEIQISLFKPIEKKKELEGILKSYTINEITIEEEGQEQNIERNKIAQIKLKYHWES